MAGTGPARCRSLRGRCCAMTRKTRSAPGWRSTNRSPAQGQVGRVRLTAARRGDRRVENCVTWVFTALVTAFGQAWVDFDVYMPDCWPDLRAGRGRDPGGPGVRHQAGTGP